MKPCVNDWKANHLNQRPGRAGAVSTSPKRKRVDTKMWQIHSLALFEVAHFCAEGTFCSSLGLKPTLVQGNRSQYIVRPKADVILSVLGVSVFRIFANRTNAQNQNMKLDWTVSISS